MSLTIGKTVLKLAVAVTGGPGTQHAFAAHPYASTAITPSSSILTRGIVRALSTTASASAMPSSKTMLKMAVGTAFISTAYMVYKGRNRADGLFNSDDPATPNTEAARVAERIHKYNLIEKKITPDGNCQFRALADQIMEDQNRHKEVRTRITEWLKSNEKYSIDDNNTTCLGDFLDRDQYPSWENYVKHMSGNRAWGDHLTLLAATEAFGVNLWVLSSIEVPESPTATENNNGIDQYITTLSPRIARPSKTARLAHYHELHYTSLHPDPSSSLAVITPKTSTSAEPA